MTFAVALLLALMLESSELGMFLFIMLVGVGFSALPVIACWTIFARGIWKWRAFALMTTVVLIVAALTTTAYFQASREATLQWFVMSTVEALFSILCLLVLHRLGYRIIHPARQPAA